MRRAGPQWGVVFPLVVCSGLLAIVFMMWPRSEAPPKELVMVTREFTTKSENIFGEPRNIFGEEPVDKMQPAFHVAPRLNWLNDPNGCEFDGETYRVAYQHNPGSPRWGDISWGMATSSDLVSWRREPTILTSPRPSYESLGAWSGNALDYEFYAYSCSRKDRTYGKSSALCLATKRGERVIENPVLEAPENTNGDWRDPAPFSIEGRTFLAIGASLRGEGLVLLVERVARLDFRHLEDPFFRISQLLDTTDDLPTMLECPDLVRVDKKDLFALKLSIGPPKSHDVVILGKIHVNAAGNPIFRPVDQHMTKRCSSKEPTWSSTNLVATLDCGNAYAGQSVKNAQENIFFAWAQDDFKRRLLYNGALTLPRILSYSDDEGLRYRFSAALAGLRLEEIVAETSQLDIPETWADRFELHFRVVEGSEEPVIVSLLTEKNESLLDMTLGVSDGHSLDADDCHMMSPSSKTLDLRLFVDGSLLEFDLDDGLSACAIRLYRHTLITSIRISHATHLQAYHIGLLP